MAESLPNHPFRIEGKIENGEEKPIITREMLLALADAFPDTRRGRRVAQEIKNGERGVRGEHSERGYQFWFDGDNRACFPGSTWEEAFENLLREKGREKGEEAAEDSKFIKEVTRPRFFNLFG